MEGKVELSKIKVKYSKIDDKDEEGTEPVSPLGQYLNSSVLSLSVIVVFESEVPVDPLRVGYWVETHFLPCNPRFSSVMIADNNGTKQWKKVEVNIEDHLIVPKFPSNISIEFYDNYFNDYLTKVSVEQFPQTKPGWEFHILNYPMNNAVGSIIFKIHHSLGDGYSLMGVLLSCLRNAENPDIPLTFPSAKLNNKKLKSKRDFCNGLTKSVANVFRLPFNTTVDFVSSLLKGSFLEDDLSPVRSGDADFKPVSIVTMAFSLHHIKQVKDFLGVTINDVVMGIMFLGTRLYMEATSQGSSNAYSTALVLFNTRMSKEYKSPREMIKSDDSPWGNNFTFLSIPVPELNATKVSNPLEFIVKSHQNINRMKRSLGSLFVGLFLQLLNKIRGYEAAAKFVHKTIKSSTLGITNMVGPLEKMTLATHPIKGFYFMVAGAPHSIVTSVMSYNGELRVGVGAEYGFINVQHLKTCIEKAFEMMLSEVQINP